MKEITKKYKKLLFNLKSKTNIDAFNKDKRSLNDLFNYFGTDKGTNVVNPYSHDSEEILGHGFAKFYEKKFLRFKSEKFNLLEIGTWEGSSTASFALFFPFSKIYGIDKNFRFKYKSKRINFSYCDVTDENDLKKFDKMYKEKSFKIIIDDASHILTDMIYSLKVFFKYLESGGYFVIEDFNAPIYFTNLNNGNGNEVLISDILNNIKKKIYFKSEILSKSDQKFLFENILEIEIFKGKTKISDIAFLKKK